MKLCGEQTGKSRVLKSFLAIRPKTWAGQTLKPHCISIPKIKNTPFRQVTYFLLPLQSFTYSTHAATWDKLTGPFLLFPFILNLFKHVIHAHPSLLIHRVISPPCGSVHIPINKTFPEYTSLCRAETSHLYPKNSRPKYSCWRHIHNALVSILSH